MGKSPLSGNTDWYGLINEELPDSMSFYYEKVMSGGERIRAMILEFLAISEAKRVVEFP